MDLSDIRDYEYMLWRGCLSKKAMTHSEAEETARRARQGRGGKNKGKRRKLDKYMKAYRCLFGEHWHVGHTLEDKNT